MDTLKTSFIPNIPHSTKRDRALSRPRVSFVICGCPESWKLSDGVGRQPQRKPFARNPRKPLSDDDARRIIHAKAQYLRRLRRNQGPSAQIPRWIRRTPEQMAQLLQDDRNGHIYGGHVVAAIRTVRALAERPEGSYDMREMMASFVAKLSFREMCAVLKEQRGWRQARDFFSWMKLQLCYRPSVIVYTIILRIYGQVGKIKLAEEIFLEMLEAGCEPDVVACGTLLCSYARWGRNKDMILFHSAVRSRDIVPTVGVYNFMLSSLQKQKLHQRVIHLWEQMLDARVEPNRFTYTIVVSSYVKEDLIKEAFDVFHRMRKSGFVPEEATYSLLINLSVKHDNEIEASVLHDEMKAQGITPSRYTYASLLMLNYKNADYSKALLLFEEMEANNILPDEVVYGIIVRIYGKLGFHKDAERSFGEIQRLGLLSDEKTYVAMAQVHLNAGNHDKALEVLVNMNSKKVELSDLFYCTILRCYIAKEDVTSAEDTFQTLSRFGLPSSMCCNDLLRLYVRLGFIDKAKAFISEIREAGVKFNQDLYRTAVSVYSKVGMVTEADHLIGEMEANGFDLDKITQTHLMAIYGESGRLSKAENLMKKLDQTDAATLGVMVSMYLERDDTYKSKGTLASLLGTIDGLSVASRLVCKYADEGDLGKAEFIHFQSIEMGFKPEVPAIASMISLYGRNQLLEEARKVFDSVPSSEISKAIYSSMIDAFCKCGAAVSASNLFRRMVEQGHNQDPVIVSVLVNALTKHKQFHEAESIIYESFDANVKLDTVAYNTCIKSMLEAGKLHYAIEIYDQMNLSHIPSSMQTYNTMISVYGQGGKLQKAIELFNVAKCSGLLMDEKIYSNMIGFYGKSGRIQEADSLFSEMVGNGIQPGKIGYDIMMNVYGISGLCKEAESLLLRMRENGFSPDSYTFLSLVRSYTEVRRLSEAEEVIDRMQNEGINPSCSHFNLLILILANEGYVKEVETIYHKMLRLGVTPDLSCCRAMLRMYMDHSFVEEGIYLFESVGDYLKPDGFILSAASHLYKSVGKNAEAENILDEISRNGLVFLTKLRVGSKMLKT